MVPETPYVRPEDVRVERISDPGRPEVFMLTIKEVNFWNGDFLMGCVKKAVDCTETGLIYPRCGSGPFLIFGDSWKALSCFLNILDYFMRHSCPRPRPPCVWTL